MSRHPTWRDDRPTRLPNSAGSRAVLIGCAHYEELPALLTVTAGVEGLCGALTHPDNGGFTPDTCQVIRDPADTASLSRELLKAAYASTDTLLVAYTGHGVLDERNHLHLALTGTSTDQALVPVTALAYDRIRDILAASPARNRIVILDCCFAGRAIHDMTAATLADRAAVEGSYVLTSTSADHTAVARPGDRYPAFTAALLNLLRQGIPDGPDLLTLETLYPYLRRNLAARGLPEPRRQGTDTINGLALTRNPAVHPPVASSVPVALEVSGNPGRPAVRWAYAPDTGVEAHNPPDPSILQTLWAPDTAGRRPAPATIVVPVDWSRAEDQERVREQVRAAGADPVLVLARPVVLAEQAWRSAPGPVPPTRPVLVHDESAPDGPWATVLRPERGEPRSWTVCRSRALTGCRVERACAAEDLMTAGNPRPRTMILVGNGSDPESHADLLAYYRRRMRSGSTIHPVREDAEAIAVALEEYVAHLVRGPDPQPPEPPRRTALLVAGSVGAVGLLGTPVLLAHEVTTLTSGFAVATLATTVSYAVAAPDQLPAAAHRLIQAARHLTTRS